MIEDFIEELKEYSHVELQNAWDRLEKLTLTPYVELKMTAIREEQNRREMRRVYGQ